MHQRALEWRRTILATFAVFVIFAPIYFVFIGGFMTNEQIHHQPPYLIPPTPTWDNYAEAWSNARQYMKNSAVISLGVLAATVLVATPASFAMAKLSLRLERAIMFLMAFALMLPASATVIPLFLIFHRLQLLNTHLGVIIAVSVFTIPFAVVMLTAYMRSIPSTLIEAAQLDGASLFSVFFHIVVPIARPAITTAGLLALLLAWGDFIFSVSFLQQREIQPMSVGLYTFVGQYGIRWNALMAASMIYAFPPIVAVIVAGRALVSGLTSGALKD